MIWADDTRVEFHLVPRRVDPPVPRRRLRDRGARGAAGPEGSTTSYAWAPVRVGAPLAGRGDLEGPQAGLTARPRHGPFGLAVFMRTSAHLGLCPSPGEVRMSLLGDAARDPVPPGDDARPRSGGAPCRAHGPAPTPPSSSRSATCASATARSRPSRASRSRSTRARPTACSGPTAPARPPRSPWSAACSPATAARSRSTASRSTSARSRRRRGSATCPRSSRSTRTSRRARTSSFFGRLYGLGGARAQGARGRGPRADRPHRAGRRSDGPLQRRHAAPAQHRHRPAPPAAPPAARRADGRRRPPEPQRDPGVDRRARPAGHGDPVHDPLHGGGRAAVRPDRDHRRRRDPGRGHAAATSWRSIGERDAGPPDASPATSQAAAAAAARRSAAWSSAAARGDELEILVADAGRLLPRLLEAVEGAGAARPRRRRWSSPISRPCSSTSPAAPCATRE